MDRPSLRFHCEDVYQERVGNCKSKSILCAIWASQSWSRIATHDFVEVWTQITCSIITIILYKYLSKTIWIFFYKLYLCDNIFICDNILNHVIILFKSELGGRKYYLNSRNSQFKTQITINNTVQFTATAEDKWLKLPFSIRSEFQFEEATIDRIRTEYC